MQTSCIGPKAPEQAGSVPVPFGLDAVDGRRSALPELLPQDLDFITPFHLALYLLLAVGVPVLR